MDNRKYLEGEILKSKTAHTGLEEIEPLPENIIADILNQIPTGKINEIIAKLNILMELKNNENNP